MQSKPTPVPCRAALRARVAACLRAQRGDTLIEVLVAALLVALIATASLTGFGAIGGAVGNQRNEEQAATLAQQDQARLRGLNITQLSGTLGNNAATGGVNTVIDGTTYNVTSKSQFVSGAGGTASCSTSGATGNADEVATTSTVTWAPGNDGRPPVILHGIITPAQGGSLVVSAQTPSSTSGTGSIGLPGVTATVTGPTTVPPLTTDSNGCAVFAGLVGGTYTVTYSAPGFVDKNGNPPASWSGAVTSTQTVAATPLLLAQDGAIAATFTTFFNGSSHPATSDTFVATNSVAGIAPRVFGTDSTPSNNAYAPTVTSPSTVFPFTNGYSVYAGTCAANLWPATPPAVPIVTVAPGATSSPSSAIPEPAMIVLVWGDTFDDPNPAIALAGTWLHVANQSGDYNSTETTSIVANSTATLTFTGTSVQWLGTTGPVDGKATVSIDGGAATTVDTYSLTTKHQQLIYTKAGLTNASHTITITALGTHSSGTGNLVSIDAINVPGAPALETIVPNVTVTDTDAGCASNEDYPLEQIPTPTQGSLLSPGEPYGNYSVCADNGSNSNTGTVANTSFVAGNTVNIYLGYGSTNLASGTCP
jgi:Tfp pilus assembly protein PilV